MVSWWRTVSYFNNEPIKIGYIELMNDAYGSSGSFVSRVSSKYIGHNTYIGKRSHLCSKPTPIHGPVNKFDFYYSYSRSHFSWLPQAVVKELINCLSQKVSYASVKIDPVFNGFSINELKSHLQICYP